MSISITHKNPIGVRRIVFDLLLDKVEPLLCVMVLEHMFQDHNSGAKFHRSTRESRENLRQGKHVFAETTNGLATGFVAIPSVIFFPGQTIGLPFLEKEHYHTIHKCFRKMYETLYFDPCANVWGHTNHANEQTTLATRMVLRHQCTSQTKN